MTGNRTTELLPCPFCGGEAHGAHEDYGDTHYWRVYCDTVGCAFGISKVFHSEAEAVAAWNARYHCGLTDEDYNILLDELGVSERTCKRVLYKPTGVLVCSECGAGMPMQLDKYCYLNYCPNCGCKVVE